MAMVAQAMMHFEQNATMTVVSSSSPSPVVDESSDEIHGKQVIQPLCPWYLLLSRASPPA